MISMGCEMADAPLRLTIRGVSSGNRSLSRVDLLIAGDDNFQLIHLQEMFAKFLCVGHIELTVRAHGENNNRP